MIYRDVISHLYPIFSRGLQLFEDFPMFQYFTHIKPFPAILIHSRYFLLFITIYSHLKPIIAIPAISTQSNLHFTLKILFITHYTLKTTNNTLNTTHQRQYNINYLLHTTHYKLHTMKKDYTLDITDYTLHTTNNTIHTKHYTLNTTHYTLHTTQLTPHTKH